MERGTHYTLQIKGGIGMKLKFIGADHEVTGSCHYLEACGKHILVDYGMEQGENVFENRRSSGTGIAESIMCF